MAQVNRGRIATAVVFILLGVWFLVVELVPGMQIYAFNETTWPLVIVGLGAVLAILGVATWTPGLLVPACVVAGIGGLMYWQNLNNEWESWAYAWTLIPGFVGLGIVLSSLMQGRVREAVLGGGWTILISFVLFLIFSSFLGGPVLLGAYWPALLILLGVILLAQSLFKWR